MKLNFKLDQPINKKADKVFILVKFAGGDANTEHPEEYLLPFKYSEISNNLELLEKEVTSYKTLKRALDVNCADYCENYDDVKTKFGEEIADLYDNAPNDPQADYQFKCYIDDIILIAYDSVGNKYKSYTN